MNSTAVTELEVVRIVKSAGPISGRGGGGKDSLLVRNKEEDG